MWFLNSFSDLRMFTFFCRVYPVILLIVPTLDTQYIIPSRKVLYRLVSVVSTPYEGILLGRSDALPASYVRLFAPPLPSQSKPRSVRTEAGGLHDMILI